MSKFADLHIHTVYSDGTFEPEEAVQSAYEAGLSCIAICDHDVVEGVPLALAEAEKCGIEVIPGVELSSDIENGELHMLGYFVDYEDKNFIRQLDDLKSARVERVRAMCQRLKEIGINIEAEEVFELSGPGTVGRLHIARVMVAKGYVPAIPDAFRKYIGDNGPAYINRFRLFPEDAVRLITGAKGVPVIAHPYSLSDESLIGNMVSAGVKGIEVFYPEHNSSLSQHYIAIAEKFNLVMTGGSDFHGLVKPAVKLGQVKLPYEFVEKLRAVRV